MGYTHGKMWDDESIKKAILQVKDDTNEIEQFYIVPSVFVMHNTQISIGQYNSKYHKYKDRWDYLENISNLFASLEA